MVGEAIALRVRLGGEASAAALADQPKLRVADGAVLPKDRMTDDQERRRLHAHASLVRALQALA